MELSQFLTIDEVASLLQLSTKTVRGLVKSDQLPAVQIQGSIRIHAPSLLRWVLAHDGNSAQQQVTEVACNE